MRQILWVLPLGLLALLDLSGCASPDSRNTTADAIRQEMEVAAQGRVKPIKAGEINNALLPPLSVIAPKMDTKPLETRFDLAVNNTPANQVFMAIVSGTRYNMLVPQEVSGNISLSLKDVTVFEALDAIHELYGYEYKVEGTRIYIQPMTLQTRLFQINYLTATRAGSSSLSVDSATGTAGVTAAGGGVGVGTLGVAGVTGATGATGAAGGGGAGNSNVTMTTNPRANFWLELETSLKSIVGNQPGRNVVVNLMSGVIVVRAMPDELRNVAAYLKASQISVERQVILEAKIVDVTLNGGYQSGVNWAGFKNGPNSHTSLGQVTNTLSPTGAMTDNVLAATAGSSVTSVGAAGTLFGMAFQTSNFAAMLNFLETQGTVHVLSSPRIATVNNQKAILKVGSDQFYITGFTPGTLPTSGVNPLPGTPSVPIYTSMFAGIALDVTPSINENNDIILHVHPSVSDITPQNVPTSTGGTVAMAQTKVSETDSVIRAHDGQIVVIGGLMREETDNTQSGLPGLSKGVFGQTQKTTVKRELILLLKPTVVEGEQSWSDDIAHSRDRLSKMVNASGEVP